MLRLPRLHGTAHTGWTPAAITEQVAQATRTTLADRVSHLSIGAGSRPLSSSRSLLRRRPGRGAQRRKWQEGHNSRGAMSRTDVSTWCGVARYSEAKFAAQVALQERTRRLVPLRQRDRAVVGTARDRRVGGAAGALWADRSRGHSSRWLDLGSAPRSRAKRRLRLGRG